VKNLLEFAPKASLFIRQALLFAAMFALFHFVGTFSKQQAIVLALASYIAFQTIDRVYWRDAGFCPMGILVMPNWGTIVTKFGLVKNEEEWKAISERLEALPENEFNVLRNGVCFYSLTPKLMYLVRLNQFMTPFQFMSIVEVPELNTWLSVRVDGPVFRVEIGIPKSRRDPSSTVFSTQLGIFWIEPVRKYDLTRFCGIEHLDLSNVSLDSVPDPLLHRERVMQKDWKRESFSARRSWRLKLENFSVTRWEL
jgi:hypothetical protein